VPRSTHQPEEIDVADEPTKSEAEVPEEADDIAVDAETTEDVKGGRFIPWG
jgi:hypothetical protein